MSNELERRLEGMLSSAPDPDAGAGEEALHKALRALQPAGHSRRGLRTAVLVCAAVLVLLVIAAGSLAAAGALHVTFGAKEKPRPATSQLVLPKGANGVAAVIDGRLSVVTKDGLGLHGRPVSAAALSPRALYVAAGVGNSLVAMAPNGRTAWSHPAGGKVVAIAWAPDGFRIAYVVHAGHRFMLHVIYGNGINDATIDRSVRAVRPSWRADSLALAYVGAGGKAIVYDLGHTSRAVVVSDSPVTHLAFAGSGKLLALATPDSVAVRGLGVATRSSVGIGWLGGKVVAAYPTPFLVTYFPGHTIHVPGRIEAFDASGRSVALALASRSRVVLVAGTPSELRTIARLPRGARVTYLQLG